MLFHASTLAPTIPDVRYRTPSIPFTDSEIKMPSRIAERKGMRRERNPPDAVEEEIRDLMFRGRLAPDPKRIGERFGIGANQALLIAVRRERERLLLLLQGRVA